MSRKGRHSGVNASRRGVLAAFAALPLIQCFPQLAFAASTETAAVANDLDAFIRLSVMVTGVERLDRETAARIRELIRAEPWGKEHLAQISAKLLSPAGAPSSATRQKLLDPERFNEGERWFIGHLLTTWFTGIYYHQQGNHVVTYRNALMYVALEDVRPVPGHCNGAFGFWSEPPAGVKP